MAAAVVESIPADRLGPPPGSRSFPGRAHRLVLVLVGRVEVRRLGLELRRARVDVLKTGSTPSARRRSRTRDSAATRSGRATGRRARALGLAPLLARHLGELPAEKAPSPATIRGDRVEEPRVDLGPRRDLLDRHAGEDRAAQVEDPLPGGDGKLLRAAPRGAAACPPSSRPSRPISSERIAFPSASAKVRPMAIASPTDFIWIVRRGGLRELLEVQRGILTTT